jgi:hypothetical protein
MSAPHDPTRHANKPTTLTDAVREADTILAVIVALAVAGGLVILGVGAVVSLF